MKRIMIPALILFLSIALTLFAQNDPAKEDWIRLFNGKDLTGWLPKIKGYKLGINYGNVFKAEDGMLKGSCDEFDDFKNRYGHIFYEKPYSYYRIRVEYRFFEPQARNAPAWAKENSGIMVHCQPPQTMGVDQDFPISIEVQLLADNGSGKRPDANVCTPGTEVFMDDTLVTQHCVSSTARTHPPDEWTTVEALVLGDSLIVHYVNGKEVIRYTKPRVGGGVVNDYLDWAKKDGTPLTGGYISLQCESQPVAFRKVELLNLEGCMDPQAKNYKSYYVKDNRSLCEY